jgi:thymidine phosphorylase
MRFESRIFLPHERQRVKTSRGPRFMSSLMTTAGQPIAESHRLRRLGIDTGTEHVVYLHEHSPVCRSEGFAAHSRLELRMGDKRMLATLNIARGGMLAMDEVGLSESAWRFLQPHDRDHATLAHPPSVDSLADVRAKLFGRTLDDVAMLAIVRDIVAHRYSNVELAAFIAAGCADHLAVSEVVALTRAMVDTGDHLHWKLPIIVDKHCIGGLAGNRTTPIVVAIATAMGLIMPKTSSRAITSPAGTADTVATLTPVELDERAMRRVVECTGGCMVWGGAMNMAPADDILIRVERTLDIDSSGQMVASVLSKKIAAGSTHVVIDMPVGPTAKVRDGVEAKALATLLTQVADAFGLRLRVLLSDGMQPVGRGIGPALEAHDVLAVLRNQPGAPADLRARALDVAAAVLELGGAAQPGDARRAAADCLASGRAWAQFQAICEAQGGLRIPGVAAYRQAVPAPRSGIATAIDNRRLSRAAKLAGAPFSPLAGPGSPSGRPGHGGSTALRAACGKFR